MNIAYYPGVKDGLKDLPVEVQKKFYKQIGNLRNNIRHPSLRAKKHGGENDLWQGRVDNNFRFYFIIKNGYYIIVKVTRRPK